MINPKLKLTYIIIIILAASVLSLHTNTLYAMQETDTGSSTKQSTTSNNHASSDTPSVLHLLPYNDTNINNNN